VKHQEIGPFAKSLGLPLSAEQIARLEAYEDLLATTGVEIGAMGAGDAQRVRERHTLDSLRAAPLVLETSSAYDLGSGGGLPGVVLAIALPQLQIALVERRRRKVSFMEMVIDTLQISNAQVRGVSAESLDVPVEACFARALAAPAASWREASRLLEPGGRLIYFAGKGYEDPGELPGCVGMDIIPSELLESAGSLVIMTKA